MKRFTYLISLFIMLSTLPSQVMMAGSMEPGKHLSESAPIHTLNQEPSNLRDLHKQSINEGVKSSVEDLLGVSLGAIALILFALGFAIEVGWMIAIGALLGGAVFGWGIIKFFRSLRKKAKKEQTASQKKHSDNRKNTSLIMVLLAAIPSLLLVLGLFSVISHA
ncbi:MAG: hypothetical protein AAF587_11045 [Bacteroidota bacterium]